MCSARVTSTASFWKLEKHDPHSHYRCYLSGIIYVWLWGYSSHTLRGVRLWIRITMVEIRVLSVWLEILPKSQAHTLKKMVETRVCKFKGARNGSLRTNFFHRAVIKIHRVWLKIRTTTSQRLRRLRSPHRGRSSVHHCSRDSIFALLTFKSVEHFENTRPSLTNFPLLMWSIAAGPQVDHSEFSTEMKTPRPWISLSEARYLEMIKFSRLRVELGWYHVSW